jgi:hypothetical protein
MFIGVSLDAPDGVIVDWFKQELEKARVENPSPVAKPGPKAPTGRVTAATFARWRDAHIVEVAELTWWAGRRRKADRPSKAMIARWIFGETVEQPSKKLNEAEKLLTAAINCIPALYAQSLSPSK